MTAMILAAGRGERMRPLTDTTPKPLIEVGGKPLIVRHIERLASLGFGHIVINIDHLGHMIKDTLGSGSQWGVEIEYSDERECGALESGGGIIKALPLIKSDIFMVLNGDILCDYEFKSAFELGDYLAHLVLVKNPPHNPSGDFGLETQRVINASPVTFTFSGIGYYSKKLFDGYKCEKIKLAQILRDAINKEKVSGRLYEGKWIDVGTPARLAEAESIFV